MHNIRDCSHLITIGLCISILLYYTNVFALLYSDEPFLYFNNQVNKFYLSALFRVCRLVTVQYVILKT